MWSGDPQYSQWALNPSAYQNVAHEEVDWAALAQQWIQMKETLPSDQVPPAPPPPPIGEKGSGEKKKDSDVEGGEAPMDMDTKEEHDNSNSSNAQSGDANSWGSWPNWQQWGWNWGSTGGMVPPGGVPPPNQPLGSGKGSSSTGTMAVPPYGYPHNSQAYNTTGTGVYDYNHAGGSEHYSQVMASSYWTSGGPADASGVTPGSAAGVSSLMRPNRHDWRRNNRSHDRMRTSEKSDDEEDTTTVLDAAKRRQLPAWIREGLEKMEREKQKKIDRERQLKEREAYLQKKREEEENAMNEFEKNSGQPMIPKKSKFESDSEESARGDSPTPSQSSLKRKSRFRNADSPNSSPRQPAIRYPSTEPEPVKSREEQMEERMLKVRRTLTEILLEVTTEEMESIAHEVLQRAKAKAPAMQLRKTQALASLTGRL
ncbi:hypothetical protein L9F63_015671, partial [Diploptera punctata]